MNRTTRFAALAGMAAVAIAAAPPADAQVKRGEAVAIQVTGPSGTTRHAQAVLGSTGMNEVAAESVRDWKLGSGLATAVTAGTTDRPGATSIATVADVDLVAGLVTAKNVIAVATADSRGLDASGSVFEGLMIRGVPYAAGGTVAPNTRVALPGVGYVILNEQVRSGDEITVTMIRLVLEKGPLTERREYLIARAVSGR